MKYTVTVEMGTPLWSQAGHAFELGRYRWLWLAKLAAMVHCANHPYRSANITLTEQGNEKHLP